ncbi:hypothetical protein EV363DRAFT_1271377 [Boletus edulis]|nr:hypothetical protein EV363DRAFT_1271377 [Boletus edulis]
MASRKTGSSQVRKTSSLNHIFKRFSWRHLIDCFGLRGFIELQVERAIMDSANKDAIRAFHVY